MHNYEQIMPEFKDLIITKVASQERRGERESRERKHLEGILSQSSSSASSEDSSSYSSLPSNKLNPNISTSIETSNRHLFELPPIINNSVAVRQKASAKDSLAAATVAAGASLPLMIGGRSKCVLNVLSKGDNLEATENNKSSQNNNFIGPKNTAIRAKQRKQNMVSIVRPVVNRQHEHPLVQAAGNQLAHRKRLEESSIWEETTFDGINNKKSLVDELMSLEQSVKSSSRPTSTLSQTLGSPNQFGLFDDYSLLLSGANCNKLQAYGNELEQQSRQQMLIYRREEYELNKGIRKQHRFVSMKIEDRKRNLLIIQSVWFQKDFKHAIEKLVDIYHQGLVFSDASRNCDNIRNSNNLKLNSLNSSLVVDILSVIILRPQLWNLEVCQLLLPIIINDLLNSDQTNASLFENYTELSLKALKLIMTNFSPIIKTTLDSLNASIDTVGVDLSREERVSKCLNCYKLLLEAKSVIAKRCGYSSSSKFNNMYRELHQSFISFENSLKNPVQPKITGSS